MSVDRAARDAFARLVRDFRDGRIDNRRFEKGLPSSRQEDRAVRAISSWLWYSYDDLTRHKLEGRHALTPEGREFYDRCLAFLGSDEEYVWPVDNFVSLQFTLLHWPASLVIVLFLLAAAFGRWGVQALWWGLPAAVGLMVAVQVVCLRLRRRWKRIVSQSGGDWDAWPFLTREAADAALARMRGGDRPDGPRRD